ncbi:MAG: MATE family efflux transporter [Clostridia bacterium]|nr:MATE family efflux transporter [Clostridia bacterium]
MVTIDNNIRTHSVNKMETTPILKLIMQMSLPPLISMFMQFSYNMVDCMFVAQISEKALTAVSLVFPITTLMLSLAIGMGVGINVLISSRLGQKNQNEANNVVTNGIIITFIVGLIMNICVYFVAKPFISSFTTDKEIFDFAMIYLRTFSFAGIPCAVHICIQKIIQGTGNMIAPMCFQIAGVIFNFAFDPIFIFGLFGFPQLGVRGAALASVGGYTLSMILAFYVLIFRKQKVKLIIKDFKFDVKIARGIFVLGFPSFIMNALGAFMTYFANIFLVEYSTTAVAFFGAYFKIQQVIIMTLNGLIQGCIPIMSYNFGAKKEKRTREAFRLGTIIGIILTILSAVILWLFPRNILLAFKASEDMMSFGIYALRVMSVSYLFAAISTMVASFMQSVQKVSYSIVINLLRQCILLIPCMWFLSKTIGMIGIWWSFIVAELITAIISVLVYMKKNNSL